MRSRSEQLFRWSPLFGALGLVLTAQAQPVFIPDPALRAELNAWVPGCVDGSGYLDPDLPAVQAQSQLSIHVRWSPADLTGIEALTNVTRLFIDSECFDGSDWFPCWDNQIGVNAWPDGLHLLQLNYGTCTSLPSWPTTLDSLLLVDTEGYSNVPALPDGMHYLYMTTPTGFTDMPVLPSSLVFLQLGMRAGQQVPVLPDGLQDLYIAGDFGVNVPVLPPNLVTLYMDFLEGPMVTDVWPASLTSIALGSMAGLSELPASWPTGIQSIQLHALPQIDAIPALPEGTRSLWLGEMPITSLPPLPASLESLQLQELPELNCLPILPQGLTLLWIDADWTPTIATGITCVPNFPIGADMRLGEELISWNPQYLCTALNSTCPFLNPVVTGTVYLDEDANGVFDPGENGYSTAVLHVEPGEHMFGTQANGTYVMPLPPDMYTITATCDAANLLSITPAAHTADLFDPGAVDADNDFGIALAPNLQDLAISLTIPEVKIGFMRIGMITYRNLGGVTMNGTVILDLDFWCGFSGSTVPPTSTGGQVHWDFTDLEPGALRTIYFSFVTVSGLPTGTITSHSARIEPQDTDLTPENNEVVLDMAAVSSLDPNEKTVLPATASPQEIAAGLELDYLIRFQNTGTASAERIVITDTLSADLDWSTMRFIGSSHPCSWLLTGEGVLRFTFEPIALPDSTSDEPGSHGFVRFTMRPQPNLLLGESIANVANIYFDFNDPVITAPATFTVDVAQGVRQAGLRHMSIQPNPVSDQLTVVCDGSFGSAVEVIDLQGRVVIRDRISGTRTTISVTALDAGVYKLRTDGPGCSAPLRFVKQ